MRNRNINVSSSDALYFVHYDTVELYKNKHNPLDIRPKADIPAGKEADYKFDAETSQKKYDEYIDTFCRLMRRRLPSLKPVQNTERSRRKILLQNSMFSIAVEDNNWSFAVELLSRPECPYKSLQKHHFASFVKGMQDCLFILFNEIYVRTGSWTADPITKANARSIDQQIRQARLRVDPTIKTTWSTTRPQNPSKETARDAAPE